MAYSGDIVLCGYPNGRVNVRQVGAHPFDLLFQVVNVTAYLGALGAEGGDNMGFGHC
jgi:hypothetical protein